MVELLVAIAIGLILTVAVLTVQLKLGTQNGRSADAGLRDNEARAAMDAISRDLGNAGFLFGGIHLNCFAVLSFNNALPAPQYITAYPVSSLVAAPATNLPFVAGTAVTMNYPPAGSTNRSDVLVIRATLNGSELPPSATPTTAMDSSNVFSPLTNGNLPATQATNFVNGSMGMMQVTLGSPSTPPQQRVCMRVPITNVTPSVIPGVQSISSAGATMPANSYNGFATQIPALGIAGATTLTNLQLQNGILTGFPIPLPGNNSNQLTYAYFIDTDPARYRWPTLVRVSIDALTDLQIPNSRLEIGVGIVSLQVLFGVDAANTGNVTVYQTGAQVLAANNSNRIRSVKVMVLTRSIYPDKDFTNSLPVLPLQTWFSNNGYTNYTIPVDEQKHRFVAQETEVAVRNELWQ